jgi:hypothetical protein
MSTQVTKRDNLPAKYYFFQTGETPWCLANRESLQRRLADNPPEFITILGFPAPYEEGHAEDTKYIGPLYIDLDGAIEEVIPQFQKLLLKLQGDFQLDLDQIRIYATGGRGFHLELDQAIFMPAVPDEGTKHLPKIYKEMAYALFVDSMDIRVYSCKKGRMWRVANRQRANGKYKVAITPAQAFEMTPEMYAELCGSPRPFPTLQPPQRNIGLAILFVDCQRKVGQAASQQSGAVKIDRELQKRFGRNFPPCLQGLMAGTVQSPQGFNQVALQLAATAHAVGVTEDELISRCAGLIRNHASEGRYNTHAKREAELRGQFRYARNSNYTASVGGIRSILPRGFPAQDLKGLGVRK